MKVLDKIENIKLVITLFLCFIIIAVKGCVIVNSTIEYKQEPVIKTDVKINPKDTIKN